MCRECGKRKELQGFDSYVAGGNATLKSLLWECVKDADWNKGKWEQARLMQNVGQPKHMCDAHTQFET